MTNETTPKVTDPHGLLESGEPTLPMGQLASVLGCSKNALRELLHGPLHSVRWARREPEPAMYCVADARVAFEPRRAEVEAKRQRHIELEASGRAAADTAKAARIAADAKRKAEGASGPQVSRQGNSKPSKVVASTKPSGAKKSLLPTSSRRQPSAPEVIVLARRPSVRPLP